MAAEFPAERSDAGRVHNLSATRDRRNGPGSAERFGHGYQVRLDAEMLACKPFPGARKARLHFVSDEENPVFAADFLQKCKVVFRRNDESTFAQDGLGNDRGHRLRRDVAFERVLKMMRKCLRRRAFLAAIGVGEGDAINVAGKWLKARLVRMRLAGERHGQQRSAMERILEANHCGTLGVSARDLNCVFHRLRAGIDDDGFLRTFPRCQRVQLFRQCDVAFVRSHRKTEVQVLLELLAQCRYYARRAVTDVETANPACKIEIAIAVDVFERRALRRSHENGSAIVWPARNRGFAPGHQGPRARSGNFCANLNCRHFSTTQLESRRGSQALAWFRDILPSPRGPARDQSRIACTHPTALRHTLAACDSPKRSRRAGT